MCDALPQNQVDCLRNWSPEFLVSPSGGNLKLNVTIFQTYCIQGSGLGAPGHGMVGMSLRLWVSLNSFQPLVSSEQSPPLWVAVFCSLEYTSKQGQMTASLQILMYSHTPPKLWM